MTENLSSDNMDDLRRIVGSYNDEQMRKLYLKSEESFHDILDSLVKTTARSTDKTLSNTEKSMGSFFTTLKKSAQEASTKVAEDLGGSFQGVAEKTDKATKNLRGFEVALKDTLSTQKALNQTGGLSGFATAASGVALGSVSEVLTTIGSTLTSMIPAITAFAGLAAFVSATVQSFIKMGDSLSTFQQLAGGSADSFSQLLAIGNLNVNGFIFNDEDVRKLAMAYHGLGGDIENTNQFLQGFLEDGLAAQKFFQLTDQQTGQFLVNAQHLGLNTQEAFSAIYKKMADLHLPIADANSAIDEGNSIWREYGSISGRTFDDLAGDMLNVKGIMRSFNIDVKDGGTLLKGLYGSAKSQLHEASMVSMITGRPLAEVYNEKFTNPGQAVMSELSAAMGQYGNLTNGQGFIDPKQFKGSQEDLMAIMDINNRMLAKVKQQFPGIEGGLDQLMNDFRAAQGLNPGLTFDDFQANRLTKTPVGGSYAEAMQKAASAPSNIMESIQKGIVGFFDSWTKLGIPVFQELWKWLTGQGLTDAMANLGKGASSVANEAGKALLDATKGQAADAATLPPIAAALTGKSAFGAHAASLNAAAAAMGVSPLDLQTIIGFESGGNPAARNKLGSGATGLIQFMPSTARGLGTTTDALAGMSYDQQMSYVQKYYKGKNVHNLDDMYMATLMGASNVGSARDKVMFRQGSIGYTQNGPAFDKTHKGYFTAGDVYDRIEAYQKQMLHQLEKLNATQSGAKKNQEDHMKDAKRMAMASQNTSQHDLMQTSQV